MHIPFSDHSSIMLNLQSLDQRKRSGPGFWKFNANLLEDEKCVKEMRENILSFREKYNDVTDLGLKWNVVKMEIRSFTLRYSKKKARIERDKEKELQIKKWTACRKNYLPQKNYRKLLNEYNAIKVQLDKILNKKIKGTILRSKARWYENGEKKYQLLTQSRKTRFPMEKNFKAKTI